MAHEISLQTTTGLIDLQAQFKAAEKAAHCTKKVNVIKMPIRDGVFLIQSPESIDPRWEKWVCS